MRRLEAVVEIDASPSEVWSVLKDFDHYPDWNPFILSIDGPCEVGARLRVTIAPPGGRPMTLRPLVLAAEPEHELRWLGRLFVPRLFDGEHSFRMEAADAGPHALRAVRDLPRAARALHRRCARQDRRRVRRDEPRPGR